MVVTSIWMRLRGRNWEPLPQASPSLKEVNPGPIRAGITGVQIIEAEPLSLRSMGQHLWWWTKEVDERNVFDPSPISTCSFVQPLLALLRSGFSPLPTSLRNAFVAIRRGTFTTPRLHGWTSASILHYSLAPTVQVPLVCLALFSFSHPFLQAL